MKTSLIITGFLLFFCLTTNSQNLVVPGKTWTYLLGADFPEPNITGDMCYKIEGDTTIQEIVYKKLGFWHNCNNRRYIRGFLRETEEGKVYFRDNDIHNFNEYLLYDFGMKVGDTVHNGINNSSYVLDSVKIGSDGKKRYHISEIPGIKDIWIEEVGSVLGLLKEIITGGFQIFTCCITGDESLYHNPDFGSCYLEDKSFSVDAGNDTTFCSGFGQTDTLFPGSGLKIENGAPPYSYRWETKLELTPNLIFTASDFLNDTTSANPYFIDWLALPNRIRFTVYVTDAENNTAKDSITVGFSGCACYTGYQVIHLNIGDSVWLDAGIPSGNIEKIYWEPAYGLSNPDSSATWCKPGSTMNYSIVSVDTFGCVCSCHAYEIRVNEDIYSQQDYRSIHPQREVLFRNQANRIIGFRVDSVKISPDTILYPFATIQEISPDGCFSPYEASWIGKKVVIKQDGSNLFFNRNGDTISLKTQAQIDESWIAFHCADNFQVEAKVKSVSFEDFLGLKDSVKTITFQVIGKQGNTIDHDLNNLKVKISKNYGFVETLNFYLFPDFIVNYPPDRLGPYTLAGLTNPEAGVQNLKWFDVYNFNIGDEIHVQELKIQYGPFSFLKEYDNRCIYKYLERTDYADSIVYHYARKQSIETVTNESSLLVTFNDTVRSVILANPVFDKLPGEPVIDTYSVYAFYMRDDEFPMKIDPSDIEIFLLNENCFSVPVIEGCLREKVYFAGLGGPYYSCTGYVGDFEERKLVYFRKGETEWGERLPITSVSKYKMDNSLQVFPNPATDKITIYSQNSRILAVEIYDLSGTCVYQSLNAGSNRVDLETDKLPKGMYVLKVRDERDTISQKIVIK
ncbi:MAG: T9SS type A sorting domain-containing protein [Mariniphaga sp.]|nr:T9SS type A sorting domain-containing protein [Mariniphaga sp.]